MFYSLDSRQRGTDPMRIEPSDDVTEELKTSGACGGQGGCDLHRIDTSLKAAPRLLTPPAGYLLISSVSVKLLKWMKTLLFLFD